MNIESALVSDHRSLSDEYRIIVMESPSVAGTVRPGQFIHVLVPGCDSAVLRRPFSVMNANDGRLSVLYRIVGRGTKCLAEAKKGDKISVMGPLGNGFPEKQKDTHPVLVAGGYGVAPLCFLADKIKEKGSIFAGGKSKRDILCMEEFEKRGWKVFRATEDGSAGEKGLVTDILKDKLDKKDFLGGKKPEFYACGPDGMLKAVGDLAANGGWKAWLSLDKHMGCGVGACLACVQKIKTPDGNVKLVRVCKDGPIFEAGEVVWK